MRAALARRADGSDARLDAALALDARRRELLPEVEALRARQNEASGAIAAAKKAGEDATRRSPRCRTSRAREGARARSSRAVEAELSRRSPPLPNPPDPSAADERHGAREVGEPGALRQGRDHLELAGDG